MPLYNTFIEKPEVKKLSSVELLQELPFYDELSIAKNNSAFSRYARSYKIEIVDKRDPLVQLEDSKQSIIDLFKDLLNEIKGFKYQITLTVLLSKIKSDGSIEYSPVLFNSTTKTVINNKYNLDQSFQEILYRIDNWINQESGWIIEEIHNQYLNISSYSPLIGNTYIELPNELKHSKKGLINIQNDDNKCFLWCHVRHLNLIDKNPERITKKHKEFVNNLNYEGIDFPISKKDYCKIETQNKICINMFCYENKTTYPVYLSDEKFSDSIDLLLISNEFVSHYLYIKDFNRFMFNKAKHKGKKYFCRNYSQCFSSEEILNEHKEDYLVINGKQNVKLEKGFISFKNYSRQIPVPFKIHADFECVLKNIDNDTINNDSSYTRKYQDHIPCSFASKVVCVDNKYSKKIVLYKGKNAVNKFIKSILNEYNYCRKITRKYFCKNLIMSAEENERFEMANICWICDKLIENTDNKLRDHCHITGKYRGAAHYSCNINLKITKKVPAIFHNLKGYDSHLVFKELSKFNVKISVIPNGLGKYMAFTLNKNLVFIDSMLLMNSSLDKLVKNLTDKNFKCLSEEFSNEQLRLVKEKGVYPYEYMNSFKKFKENKLPDKCRFFSSLKNCGINEKEYQRAINVWKVFKIKNLEEYDDLHLKTDVLLLCDVFEKFINTCLDYYLIT